MIYFNIFIHNKIKILININKLSKYVIYPLFIHKLFLQIIPSAYIYSIGSRK